MKFLCGDSDVLDEELSGDDGAEDKIVLQNLRSKWLKKKNYASDYLAYLTEYQETPGRISGEPFVTDGGRNWLTLSWNKPANRGAGPVIAYRLEMQETDEKDESHWIEVGMSSVNSFEVFNLKSGIDYKFRITPRNQYGWGEPYVTSAPITVDDSIVNLPEFVKILPGNLKALRGKDVHFRCSVQSDDAPTITWYKNSLPIDFDATNKLSQTFDGIDCTLKIENLDENDSGRYMCEAVNRRGRVSTFVCLMVVTDPKILQADACLRKNVEDENLEKFPPQFTMRLRDRRVQMTYPVRLTCEVLGNPAPEVVWSKDGVQLHEDEHHVFVDADHFHTLEITKTKLEDSGSYAATATNENGSVSCHCNLIVDKGIRAYIAPLFSIELPETKQVKAQEELRLSAQIEAYPSVGVVWRRNEVKLRPSRRIIMTLDHDGTVELAIAPVTETDSGTYTCTAVNQVGRSETVCQVTVVNDIVKLPPPQIQETEPPCSQAPVFIKKPRSSEAVEGDTIIIECEVVGDPKPEVFWLRDFLKPKYYRDSSSFRIQGEGPKYYLEIPHAKLDFTGTYSVIARNVIGETKAVISLQIYAKGQGKGNNMGSNSIIHGNLDTLLVFKKNLQNIRCCDGDSVTLECVVSAPSTPEIRWKKDGILISFGDDFDVKFDGSRASLCIKKVYPEDEGEYTCIAYNDGERVFTSAYLLVDVPEEKEHLLSTQLTRQPGVWSKASTPRSTPRATPCRSFSPVASSGMEESTAKSRPKRLKVSAPKFYAVPHNRIAEEGETVRFQCSVTGHPEPWFHWDKDNVVVTPSTRIKISEREDLKILEIEEVTTEDAGLYRIIVENQFGRVEATARLDVLGPRNRLKAFSELSIRPLGCSKKRITRSVGKAESNSNILSEKEPKPYWYRDNESLVTSNQLSLLWDGNKIALNVRNLKLQNYGKNMAESDIFKIGNTDVFPVFNVSFKTNTLPSIFKIAPKQSFTNESYFTGLQVTVKGTNLVNFARMKDNKIIPDCKNAFWVMKSKNTIAFQITDASSENLFYYLYSLSRNQYESSLTSLKLLIKGKTNMINDSIQINSKPNPVVFDEIITTSFNCEPSHQIYNFCSDIVQWQKASLQNESTPRNRNFSLAEKHSPKKSKAKIILGPIDSTVFKGEKVVLRATYSGYPEPEILWMKEEQTLQNSDKTNIVSGEGATSLSIDCIGADDRGKYVVRVQNSLGSDYQCASIAVRGPPDPPASTPLIRSIGNNEIAIEWSSPIFDGGSQIIGYVVEMKNSANENWKVVSGLCRSLSFTMNNIPKNSKTQFRIRAENAYGQSEPSRETDEVVTATESDSLPDTKWVTVEPGENFKNKYQVLEELGKGRFGVVHLVVNEYTNRKFAAKFVKCIKMKDKEKVKEEINIMNTLNHSKLLRLEAAYENPREMVMVMEYISGGELFERIVATDFQLTEKDCTLFIKQICEGIEYMHRNKIVHLDLKPENIMCQSRTSHEIKLIDFGLAQRLEPNDSVRVFFGTPEFVAPEIINYEPIGFESDMWSIGVISYVLLSGLSPFMGENDAETFANITRSTFDFDDEAFESISQEAKDFISMLLVKRKEKRLTASQCLKNKWILTDHDDTTGNKVVLNTDKLKKFIVRRKWQKTTHAIRALGRMALWSAAHRKSTSQNNQSRIFEDSHSTNSCETDTNELKICHSESDSVKVSNPLEKLAEIEDGNNETTIADSLGKTIIAGTDCDGSFVNPNCNEHTKQAKSILVSAEEKEISRPQEANLKSSNIEQNMDPKVNVIRDKFVDLSKSIDEIDSKLESVNEKFNNLMPDTVIETKKTGTLKPNNPEEEKNLKSKGCDTMSNAACFKTSSALTTTHRAFATKPEKPFQSQDPTIDTESTKPNCFNCLLSTAKSRSTPGRVEITLRDQNMDLNGLKKEFKTGSKVQKLQAFHVTKLGPSVKSISEKLEKELSNSGKNSTVKVEEKFKAFQGIRSVDFKETIAFWNR